MKHVKQQPVIVLATPLAYQDGMDNYSGLMRYLTEHACDWQVRVVREKSRMDEFIHWVREDADAIIVSYHMDSDSAIAIVAKSTRLPMVIIDAPMGKTWANRRNTVFVNIDSKALARTAARYLATHPDYVAYGFIGEPRDFEWSDDRAAAFESVLRRKRRAFTRFQSASGDNRDADLLAWLKALDKPAAVFADCDRTAGEVLRVCKRNGIRVPFDISVLGVDNELITCTHSRPMLSSVQPDFVDEGYRAAEAVDRMLAGKRCPRKIVCSKHRLVERQSTGLVSQARQLVIRADDLIRSEACSGLKAADVSRRLNVSRRLLDLRYRQIKGQSLLDSIRTVRLEKARHLLDNTMLSLKEIAAACHLGSAAYARRLIFRNFGVSARNCRSKTSASPAPILCRTG